MFLPVLLILFLAAGCVIWQGDAEVLSALGLGEPEEREGGAVFVAYPVKGGSISMKGFGTGQENPDEPFEKVFFSAAPMEAWGEWFMLGFDFGNLTGKKLGLLYGFDEEGPLFKNFKLKNLVALGNEYDIEDIVKALQKDINAAFPEPGVVTFTVGYEEDAGEYRLSITSNPKVTLKANPKNGYKFDKWTIKYIVNEEPPLEVDGGGELGFEAARVNLAPLAGQLMAEEEFDGVITSRSRSFTFTPQNLTVYFVEPEFSRSSSSGTSGSSRELPHTGAAAAGLLLAGSLLLGTGTVLYLKKRK